MRQATRYYVTRGLATAFFLALFSWIGYEGQGWLQARALQGKLLAADTNEVPAIVQAMDPYRGWLDPLLHQTFDQVKEDKDAARKQLNFSLALLPVDPTQTKYLRERLLKADPQEVLVICNALEPHRIELLDQLRHDVEQPGKDKGGATSACGCGIGQVRPGQQVVG